MAFFKMCLADNLQDATDCGGLQSTTRLHSKYINSHNADHLSRLKLGKTYFNSQLHHINLKDTPHCTTCLEQHGVEVSEDYKHTLYHCPNTRAIIHNIINDYFPNTNETNYFSISDILIDSTHYKNKNYEGNEGKLLLNIIWDIFQVSIAIAHSAGKSPTYANTDKLITTTLNEITKTTLTKFGQKGNQEIRAPRKQVVIKPGRVT
jgi:hypothetical protein